VLHCTDPVLRQTAMRIGVTSGATAAARIAGGCAVSMMLHTTGRAVSVAAAGAGAQQQKGMAGRKSGRSSIRRIPVTVLGWEGTSQRSSNTTHAPIGNASTAVEAGETTVGTTVWVVKVSALLLYPHRYPNGTAAQGRSLHLGVDPDTPSLASPPSSPTKVGPHGSKSLRNHSQGRLLSDGNGTD
jgi:hypothetical protein